MRTNPVADALSWPWRALFWLLWGALLTLALVSEGFASVLFLLPDIRPFRVAKTAQVLRASSSGLECTTCPVEVASSQTLGRPADGCGWVMAERGLHPGV